ATVVGQLDQAASGVETATGSIHQAYNYAQQAEVNSVTAVVGAVFDGIGGAKQSIENATGKTEAYRQQIEAVAAGN
ncbi:MAG: hypothetical protein ACRDT6_04930, partial [Micromonosporaceae bacterium]